MIPGRFKKLIIHSQILYDSMRKGGEREDKKVVNIFKTVAVEDVRNISC